MKPLDQTILHTENTQGNCFTACVASILECSIEECPDFYADGWITRLTSFLAEKGFSWDYIHTKELPLTENYLIAVGDSPRGHAIGHAVIYKQGLMVHDPHPDKTGITSIRAYWEFKSEF